MPAKYQYTRLTEPDSFRLILLQPSPHLTAPLQLAILTATLSQYEDDILDHYVALSYVWGNQKDIRTIDVDSKQLEITASLDSALRHIRDANRPMKIWADGICINQTDIVEKNIQIREMRSIYGLARSTIIFLGEATAECNLVLDALCSLSGGGPRVSKMVVNILHDITSLYKQQHQMYVKGSHPSSSVRFRARQRQSQNPMSKDLLALAEEHILKRPWFSRVWVLQELVLSPDPWIQLGGRRLPWNIFSKLLRDAGTDQHLGDGFRSLAIMDSTRNSFASSRLSSDLDVNGVLTVSSCSKY
jgi:hypothetical protein